MPSVSDLITMCTGMTVLGGNLPVMGSDTVSLFSSWRLLSSPAWSTRKYVLLQIMRNDSSSTLLPAEPESVLSGF